LDKDFTKIDYLKNGNDKQKLVFALLTNSNIIASLQQFDPILVGTIPIDIDIENSDLDIICSYHDKYEFIKAIHNRFCDFDNFKIKEVNEKELNAVISNFRINNFEIEIFGQNIPTRQQNAYRHMIVEYKLLCERDEAFRQKIIDLKKQGYKTEPSFAIALELSGNPYLELLRYENI
jgi:hypothetical protein